MDKKILFISIAVVLVIIVSLIFIILHQDNKNIDTNMVATPAMTEDPIVIERSIQRVISRNEFFNVRTCVTKFYVFLSKLNNVNTKKEELQQIYDMLNEKYIEYNDITVDNMKSKLSTVKENINIIIDDMYVSQRDENISVYFVYGKLLDKSVSKHTNFSMIVNVDKLNRTFNVCLQDYIESKYNNINEGDNIEFDFSDKIENKIYNTYESKAVSDIEYIKYLFNDYKDKVIYDKKLAYEVLDGDYRKSKFKDFNEYNIYAKNSVRKLIMADLREYKYDKNSDYKQYVVKDSKGNYYIFRETAPMKYSIILDTFSLQLPEFIEKYDSTTEQGKVVLNIEKFVGALNEKDIDYIYNILSNGFKKSKYNTKDSLEKFINKKLNGNYSVEYGSFKTEGEIYIYNIVLKNYEDEAKSLEMQIIMQLKESRNFEMSFSLK